MIPVVLPVGEARFHEACVMGKAGSVPAEGEMTP